MTDATAFAGVRQERKVIGRAYLRSAADRLLDPIVAFWIFSGGIILFEPSLYELTFLLVIGTALLSNFKLHRSCLGLLLIFVCFTPFALIGAFQVKVTPLPQAVVFSVVTLFLLLTSYVAANYVADAPEQRMRIIMRPYTAVAIIVATLGTLAYLRLMPGADAFLLFGRARSTFKDPNVYGPFLILPAMFALQRVLLGDRRRMIRAGIVVMILFLGVFVSFSRGAWGHLVASSAMVFGLSYWLVAHAREKVRMLILAMLGVALLIGALAALLSIPEVSELFSQRANITQSYDTGESGRLGRQGYAFDLALQNPWGIGPLEFRHLRIAEEPHNTYVNVLHVYGWGGGLAYYALVILTLIKGFTGLRDARMRLLLIPLISVYLPVVLESAIIDIDHWRHYFLVTGLIWGVTAAARPGGRVPADKRQALI